MSPVNVIGRKRRTDGDRDSIRDQECESGAEDRGPTPGERAQSLERGERPAQPEDRQDHGAQSEHLPQRGAERASPTSRERHRQQRQTQEQTHQQGRNADEFLARLGIHAAMRRSA